jgi:hypothetical protein
MTENSKPITKYVILKVTYNSYYVESPETWDWNNLVDCGMDENIEFFSVSDFPPRKEF